MKQDNQQIEHLVSRQEKELVDRERINSIKKNYSVVFIVTMNGSSFTGLLMS